MKTSEGIKNAICKTWPPVGFKPLSNRESTLSEELLAAANYILFIYP